jgi:two-component system LytT family response regulator
MFNTLLVDDERLARAELRRLLSPYPQITIQAEASTAEQALELMQQQAFDLVFLDIQMPGLSGLQLAPQLHNQSPQKQCRFVFCTAFDQYALDAFELNALDYLLKPVAPERLERTIQKLEQQHSSGQQQSYLPEQHGILLKFGEVSRIKRLNEIQRFESVGNHTAVYCDDGKSFLHSSLSKVEMRLNPQQFFKVSRSDIVRIDAILQIEPGLAAGTLIVVLKDGSAVEVSRRQVQQLKQLFNAWG